MCQNAWMFHRHDLFNLPPPPGLIVKAESLPCNYSIFPLCRALLVVQDGNVDLPEESLGDQLNLATYVEAQTVLLIRTGDEAELSAPISFESLNVAPWNSSGREPELSNVDAVRVTLKCAIQFIVKLYNREAKKYPQLYQPEGVDMRYNMPLIPAPSLLAKAGIFCTSLWHPADEAQFLQELYIEGKYTNAKDIIERAELCVAKRERGELDWDCMARYWKFGILDLRS